MPIEIRELVIRAIVEPPEGENENRTLTQNSTGDRMNIGLIERIEQLMKILQEKNER